MTHAKRPAVKPARPGEIVPEGGELPAPGPQFPAVLRQNDNLCFGRDRKNVKPSNFVTKANRANRETCHQVLCRPL